MIKVLRIVFFILLSSTLLSQTRYYVKNGGNNANSGLTPALAWETMAKVNGETFDALDTISFAMDDRWDANADARLEPARDSLYFNSYGTGTVKPTIDGQGLVYAFYGLTDDHTVLDSLRFVSDGSAGYTLYFDTGCTASRIINCDLDSLGDLNGIIFNASDSCYVSYTLITSNDNASVYIYGSSDCIIEYNEILSPVTGYGIRTSYGSGDADNNLIRYNNFHHTGYAFYNGNGDGNEFYYNISDSSLRPVRTYLSTNAPTNTKIYNNTFGSGYSSSTSYASVYIDANCGNGTEIFNNIFYGTVSGNQAIEVESGAGTITFKDNIYYNDAGGVTIEWKGTTVTDSATWFTNSGETSYLWDRDPGLTDHDGKDYTLASASVFAVDAGTTHSITEDYAGETVPYNSTVDVGAYEWFVVPVAAFSADDVTPTTSQTVVFTDASTNVTSWLWAFDPTSVTYMSGTSASQHPQVKFNTATTYDVTLTAISSWGSDDEDKVSYITASSSGWTYTINGVVTPTKVNGVTLDATSTVGGIPGTDTIPTFANTFTDITDATLSTEYISDGIVLTELDSATATVSSGD